MDDCKSAIENMNGSELFGRAIRCTMAKASTLDKKKPVWEKEGDVWVAEVEKAREGKRDAETQQGLSAQAAGDKAKAVVTRPLVYFESEYTVLCVVEICVVLMMWRGQS